MNTARDWEKPVRRLERLMRLKSFPVAFKLFEDKNSLSAIPFIRRMNNKSTLCQLINLVRNFDWTVGADLDDFMSVMCASVIGLDRYTRLYERWHFQKHCMDQKQGGWQKI